MRADSDSRRQTVLVAGATGYLGGYVVRAAHAAGFRVRALARNETRLAAVRESCDEVFVGEATKPATLEGLIGDASIVFSSIGKHDFARRPTPEEIDRDANLEILRRARAAGVEHFVFVSVLHGERLRDTGLRIASAREAVVDALKESGLAWTVLRPSGFFNDMQDFFDMAVKGTGWLIGDGGFRMSPIHGADLAAAAVRYMRDASARGQAFDVGGPDVFTQREIFELAFSSLGKPPRFRSLPRWTLRPLASAIGIANSTVADLVRSIGFLAEFDGVAPAHGTHHLAEFFTEQASAVRAGANR